MRMPLPAAAFDAVTMSFGLRNIADIPAALREMYRVMRPGAFAAVLDFNHSPNPLVDGVQARSAGIFGSR
jgi:demethylphylloquinol methyltransferase